VQPAGRVTNIIASTPTSFGGDAEVRFTFQVGLQARRFGYDFDGRQYTIHVSAADEAGNAGSTTAIVTVPHDMGRHSRPVFGTGGGISTGQSGRATGLAGRIGRQGFGGQPVGRSSRGHGHGRSRATATSPVVTSRPSLP